MDLKDTVLLARFAYQYGHPIVEDAWYDEAIKQLAAQGIHVNPIYEDDPIPWDILRANGIKDEEVYEWIGKPAPYAESDKYYDIVDEAKSMSIRSVNNFADAYDWFSQLSPNTELVFTPKIDGINTRRGYQYVDESLKFRVAMTRGRSSDAIDITRNVSYITQPEIRNVDIQHDLVLYSESFCRKEDIPYISAKYGIPLKIPRNAGLSMMRVTSYEQEDFKYLHSLVFRCDVAETLSGGLDWAKAHGFQTVPYTLYMWKGAMEFSQFKTWLNHLIEQTKAYTDARGWPTDGVVVEINSRSAFVEGGIDHGYSEANLALKVGLWEPGIYQSRVLDIEIVQQDETASCKAIVAPVTTTGGQEVTTVNLFNPAIMIANKIHIGSVIKFRYKNETTVDLIYDGG